MTDEDLILRLRAGDADALAELSTRYHAKLLRFAEGLLGDAGLAEDVVQELFAKLRGEMPLPDGAARPWLYKVVRNACLDRLRRHQRSPTRRTPLRTHIDAPHQTAGPGTRVAQAEREQFIRAALAQMPDEYRTPLELKYFDGLQRSEIAEILGVSDATVKGRLARGAEWLREELRKITGRHE